MILTTPAVASPFQETKVIAVPPYPCPGLRGSGVIPLEIAQAARERGVVRQHECIGVGGI